MRSSTSRSFPSCRKSPSPQTGRKKGSRSCPEVAFFPHASFETAPSRRAQDAEISDILKYVPTPRSPPLLAGTAHARAGARSVPLPATHESRAPRRCRQSRTVFFCMPFCIHFLYAYDDSLLITTSKCSRTRPGRRESHGTVRTVTVYGDGAGRCAVSVL